MSEQVTYKRYITYREHSGTGEGHTIEMFMPMAANEAEAKQKHLDRFYPDDAAQAELLKSVLAVLLESTESKDCLNCFLKQGESIHEALVKGGGDFQFRLHYNLS